MPAQISLGRISALLAVSAVLLLSACNNQYGPPVQGQPVTAGQQRYLDNQAYQKLNEDRRF
jgi:hypothetical protein